MIFKFSEVLLLCIVLLGTIQHANSETLRLKQNSKVMFDLLLNKSARLIQNDEAYSHTPANIAKYSPIDKDQQADKKEINLPTKYGIEFQETLNNSGKALKVIQPFTDSLGITRKKKSKADYDADLVFQPYDDDNTMNSGGAIDRSLPLNGIIPKREMLPLIPVRKWEAETKIEEAVSKIKENEHFDVPERLLDTENSDKGCNNGGCDKTKSVVTWRAEDEDSGEAVNGDINLDTEDTGNISSLKFKSMKSEYADIIPIKKEVGTNNLRYVDGYLKNSVPPSYVSKKQMSVEDSNSLVLMRTTRETYIEKVDDKTNNIFSSHRNRKVIEVDLDELPNESAESLTETEDTERVMKSKHRNTAVKNTYTEQVEYDKVIERKNATEDVIEKTAVFDKLSQDYDDYDYRDSGVTKNYLPTNETGGQDGTEIITTKNKAMETNFHDPNDLVASKATQTITTTTENPDDGYKVTTEHIKIQSPVKKTLKDRYSKQPLNFDPFSKKVNMMKSLEDYAREPPKMHASKELEQRLGQIGKSNLDTKLNKFINIVTIGSDLNENEIYATESVEMAYTATKPSQKFKKPKPIPIVQKHKISLLNLRKEEKKNNIKSSMLKITVKPNTYNNANISRKIKKPAISKPHPGVIKPVKGKSPHTNHNLRDNIILKWPQAAAKEKLPSMTKGTRKLRPPSSSNKKYFNKTITKLDASKGPISMKKSPYHELSKHKGDKFEKSHSKVSINTKKQDKIISTKISTKQNVSIGMVKHKALQTTTVTPNKKLINDKLKLHDKTARRQNNTPATNTDVLTWVLPEKALDANSLLSNNLFYNLESTEMEYQATMPTKSKLMHKTAINKTTKQPFITKSTNVIPLQNTIPETSLEPSVPLPKKELMIESPVKFIQHSNSTNTIFLRTATTASLNLVNNKSTSTHTSNLQMTNDIVASTVTILKPQIKEFYSNSTSNRSTAIPKEPKQSYKQNTTHEKSDAPVTTIAIIAEGGGGDSDYFEDNNSFKDTSEPTNNLIFLKRNQSIPTSNTNIMLHAKKNAKGKPSDTTQPVKSKSLAETILNALLKLNPNSPNKEMTRGLWDSETVKRTVSLYKTLVQITLDVISGQTPMITNRTWYRIGSDDETISLHNVNKNILINERDEDVADVIFAKTFSKGAFSQANVYCIENITLPSKDSHLDSNLGEDSDDTNLDSETFDYEPIFSSSEMYEYNLEAKSLVETILNLILNQTLNETSESVHTPTSRQLEDKSPIYKHVVNTILNIFNNKTKNGTVSSTELHSYKKKIKNKTPDVASNSSIQITANIFDKQLQLDIPSTKLYRAKYLEEVLPISKAVTQATLTNGTVSIISTTTAKQTQSEKTTFPHTTYYDIINATEKIEIVSVPVKQNNLDFYKYAQYSNDIKIKYLETKTIASNVDMLKVTLTTESTPLNLLTTSKMTENSTVKSAFTKSQIRKPFKSYDLGHKENSFYEYDDDDDEILSVPVKQNNLDFYKYAQYSNDIKIKYLETKTIASNVDMLKVTLTTESTPLNLLTTSKMTENSTVKSAFTKSQIRKPFKSYDLGHKENSFYEYDDDDDEEVTNSIIKNTKNPTSVNNVEVKPLKIMKAGNIDTTKIFEQGRNNENEDDEYSDNYEDKISTTKLPSTTVSKTSRGEIDKIEKSMNFYTKYENSILNDIKDSAHSNHKSTTDLTDINPLVINVVNSIHPKNNVLFKNVQLYTTPRPAITKLISKDSKGMLPVNSLYTKIMSSTYNTQTSVQPSTYAGLINTPISSTASTYSHQSVILPQPSSTSSSLFNITKPNSEDSITLSTSTTSSLNKKWIYNYRNIEENQSTIQSVDLEERETNSIIEIKGFNSTDTIQNTEKTLTLSNNIHKNLESFTSFDTMAAATDASNFTPLKLDQNKIIPVPNLEDLTEMLYYEMPTIKHAIKNNNTMSTTLEPEKDISILTEKILRTMIKELKLTKDPENEMMLNRTLLQLKKVSPFAPNLETILREMLLNFAVSETTIKPTENVTAIEISDNDKFINELYPKWISVSDPDLEKSLRNVLLRKHEESTEILPLNDIRMTTEGLYWKNIMNALEIETQSSILPTLPFQMGDILKTTTHKEVLERPQSSQPPDAKISKAEETINTMNEIISFNNLKLTDKVNTDKSEPVKTHFTNFFSTKIDEPKKAQNKTTPTTSSKSFFYKKPTVETYKWNLYSNETLEDKETKMTDQTHLAAPLINTCGLDNAPFRSVKEGTTNIEKYPWLGFLIYPKGEKQRLVTAVVLVTVQLVIASAWEIDKLPKQDFRHCTKVILGHNCTGPRLGVLNYNYHPDFRAGFQSTLAIIQIDTADQIGNCTSSKVQIYKMDHVSMESCHQYYRNSGLDATRSWPRHYACGRARRGGACHWQSGAVLVVKQEQRWHLLGFGVSGHGCEAPSRYIDYGMHTHWVNMSVGRIGQPAVTRLASNSIILRRAQNQIQRFGPCDEEEVRTEIFSNSTEVLNGKEGQGALQAGRVQYNLTIWNNVDYQCVEFKAYNMDDEELSPLPKLVVQRYYPVATVSSNIDLNLTIDFYYNIKYNVLAYGQKSNTIPKPNTIFNLNSQITQTERTEENKNEKVKFARQPHWEANGRRYISRKSLEKYKNTYHSHNKMVRPRRKALSKPQRKKLRSSKTRLQMQTGRKRNK